MVLFIASIYSKCGRIDQAIARLAHSQCSLAQLICHVIYDCIPSKIMTLWWCQGLLGGVYPLRPFYLYVMCTYYVESYAIHRHVSIANVTSMNRYVFWWPTRSFVHFPIAVYCITLATLVPFSPYSLSPNVINSFCYHRIVSFSMSSLAIISGNYQTQLMLVQYLVGVVCCCGDPTFLCFLFRCTMLRFGVKLNSLLVWLLLLEAFLFLNSQWCKRVQTRNTFRELTELIGFGHRRLVQVDRGNSLYGRVNTQILFYNGPG